MEAVRRARARIRRARNARGVQPATVAASGVSSPSQATSSSASRSRSDSESRALEQLVSVDHELISGRVAPVGGVGEELAEAPAALICTPPTRDDVASSHQEPPQRLVGHNVAPAPRNREGLREHVVGIARTTVSCGVGVDTRGVLVVDRC